MASGCLDELGKMEKERECKDARSGGNGVPQPPLAGAGAGKERGDRCIAPPIIFRKNKKRAVNAATGGERKKPAGKRECVRWQRVRTHRYVFQRYQQIKLQNTYPESFRKYKLRRRSKVFSIQRDLWKQMSGACIQGAGVFDLRYIASRPSQEAFYESSLKIRTRELYSSHFIRKQDKKTEANEREIDREYGR